MTSEVDPDRLPDALAEQERQAPRLRRFIARAAALGGVRPKDPSGAATGARAVPANAGRATNRDEAINGRTATTSNGYRPPSAQAVSTRDDTTAPAEADVSYPGSDGFSSIGVPSARPADMPVTADETSLHEPDGLRPLRVRLSAARPRDRDGTMVAAASELPSSGSDGEDPETHRNDAQPAPPEASWPDPGAAPRHPRPFASAVTRHAEALPWHEGRHRSLADETVWPDLLPSAEGTSSTPSAYSASTAATMHPASGSQTVPVDPFVDDDLEERLADLLERALAEAGIDRE